MGALMTKEGDITMISHCGVNVLDLLLNEIKAKTMTTMKILWNYLFSKKPKSLYSSENQYVLAATQFCPMIMSTLIYLGQQNLEQATMNGYINTMMRMGIDVLCFLSAEESTKPIFLMYSFKLYL